MKYRRAAIPICSLNPGKEKLESIKNEMRLLADPTQNCSSPTREGHFYFFSCRKGIGTASGDAKDPCNVYRPGHNGTYTFEVKATVASSSTPYARLRIQYDIISASNQKLVTRGVDIPLDGTPLPITHELEAGGYIRFWIGGAAIFPYPKLQTFSFTCIDFKPIGAVFPTDNFPVLKNLPDITQLDLFKTVCQLYGLVVSVDERSKLISAYTFNEVVSSAARGDYLDWSHKLDSSTHSSTYQWRSYGKRSYIAYAEDEGQDGEKVVNSHYFNIDSEVLPAEKTLFTLPFAACEDTNVCGLDMAKIRMVEAGDSSPDSITEPKPKLVYLTKKSGVVVLFISREEIPQTSVIISQASPLSMIVFVENYYTALSNNLLSKVRMLKEKLWLTPLDIQNFTHQRPVYFSRYGCCFYVNKIANYHPDKLTTVELVAILSEF